MSRNPFAMGAVLAGWALVALTSCNTDNHEPSPGSLAPVSPSVAAVSAYDIIKLPVTVDGDLSEWANIPGISLADQSGRGAGMDNTAKVKLAWDDTYLYAAYDVTDTEILAAQTSRDHGAIYKDDAVELYIDPQGDGSGAGSMTTTDYQFLANVRDALGDASGDGAGSKNAGFNAASFLAKPVTNGTLNASGTDVGYTVELRISWADLGVTPAAGHFMRIDPAVDDDDTANTAPEYFDWAGLTIFNNPDRWKDVQLVNRPPAVSAYDLVKLPAALTIDGNLADWAGVAEITMADDEGNGRGAANNSAKVKLAWDPTYLYVAYDVTDTELLADQTARDNSQIYKDDEVELYIDPQGDGWNAPKMTPTDYQFLANLRSAVGDMKGTAAGGKDASFNAASFLANAVTNGTLNATGTDVGYTLEARIAWTDLGVTPAVGNFLRIDPAVGDRDAAVPPATPEGFDWAGLALYNEPSAWKDVKLAVDSTAPAAPTNLALTAASASEIDLSWTTSSSADVAKYKIYRSTSGTPTLYKTVAGSLYQDAGLAPGTYMYQVSATDAAGNESAKTAAQSATVGATAEPLRVGVYDGFSLIGKGPGGDVGAPRYSVLHGIPSTTSALPSLIARAEAANVHLILNLAHSPPTYTDPAPSQNGHPCMTFNWTKYLAWLDSAAAYPEVGDALARGKASVFVIDEPLHPNYCGSITKAMVNQMGLETKARFPRARTMVRAGTNVFSGTVPPGGWTGIDYGMAQYGRYPTGATLQGETPSAYFQRQKAALAAVGLGTIPGLNLWDGGGGAQQNSCWDYLNTGSSSGRIHGTLQTGVTDGHGQAQGEPCSTTPTGTYWVTSPAVMRETIDAAAADLDFPLFTVWTHVLNNGNTAAGARLQALEARADFVAGLDYMINKGASQQPSNRWRPTK
jgi:cellulose/xylan binding protein with CBM9 domain/fibronectin type III domain protein